MVTEPRLPRRLCGAVPSPFFTLSIHSFSTATRHQGSLCLPLGKQPSDQRLFTGFTGTRPLFPYVGCGHSWAEQVNAQSTLLHHMHISKMETHTRICFGFLAGLVYCGETIFIELSGNIVKDAEKTCYWYLAFFNTLTKYFNLNG